MGWEDVAKWAWGLLVPAGWWIFNRQDKRMDNIEGAMKDKADKAELERQRDNISKIFDEIRDMRQEINDKHLAIINTIHEKFPGRQ